MHIPDGFLSTPVWAALDAAALPAAGLIARKAQHDVEEGRIPLLGVMGAFVFAAQMINFPVGLGASGHLMGGALLAVTLGPAAASVVMTAILTIQAFIFQDGGVIALGANVLNMAVAGVFAGYLPYRIWGATRWRAGAIFLGGVFSVLVSASLAVSELLFSGVAVPGAVAWMSAGLFALNAILEGAITLAVVGAIERLNPKLVQKPESSASSSTSRRAGVLALAAIALACAGVLFASAAPDVLENLAEKTGIAARAQSLLSTPFADYEASWFSSEWVRKASAGLAGLALVYAACTVFGRLLGRPRSS